MSAASEADVQVLQTAASLENLAVATYDIALALDFIGGPLALPMVRTFAMTAREHHAAHADAFNAAITRLGGKEQHDPDPVLLDAVYQARAGLTGLGPLVDLAITLEDTAAQTYVANTGTLNDVDARQVTASIMGVEAQHVAVLGAVSILVDAGLTDQIKLPPDAAALPDRLGRVGFPDAFYGTDRSRPPDEGAVT